MPKSSGFTLVEILVAISITAVIAAVAIPNLRKFNEDQQVRNASTQLVSDLRKLQSNASSGLKCPSGSSSTAWKVVLSTNSYEQFCTDSSDDQSLGISSLPSGATITTNSQTCVSNTIIFTKTTVSHDCLVTLSSLATQININITRSGAIY